MSVYIKWLVNTIQQNEYIKTVCEVGVFQGETLCQYAPLVKQRNGTIYAIDWFMGNIHEPYKGPEAMQLHYYRIKKQEIDKVYNNLIANLKKIDCLDIVKILKGDSLEQAVNISNNILDLCFIDADHTYHGVLKDIAAYKNKMKDGGIFCGHDYDQNDVKMAVIDSFINHYVVSDPTALIWVRR